MDYLEYYEEINVKKQIKKLAKKYKGKKIVLYGAGIMSDALLKNYDVSSLNIEAVCDMKYYKQEKLPFYNIPTISLEELKTTKYDVILVLLLKDEEVIGCLKLADLIGTVNEDAIVEPMFKVPFLKFMKVILKVIFC